MSVSVTAGMEEKRGGGYFTQESATQSTATTFATLATQVDLTVITGGTATSFIRNRYLLASGAVEGQRREIIMSGTGEAYVLLASGTATGMLVFTANDQIAWLRVLGGKWRILETTASLASST